MLLQLIGWAPDLDPATPGVLIDANGAIPQSDGFMAVAPFTSVTGAINVRAMAIVNVGPTRQDFYTVEYTSDTTASTATIYNFSGWSGTVRYTYTAETYTTPVVIRQFDSETYFARRGSPLVVADASGTAVTAIIAPSFGTIEVTKDFVIGFDADTGFDWHCSAFGDGRDWNLSVSNQCVRGSFFNKQGPIVAAGRSGESVLAFTETQTWVGRYVGPPEAWQWEELSREVGCVGAEAVTETPYGVCWLGNHDIYIFNGGQFAPLNTVGVRRTLFESLNRDMLRYAQVAWDRKRGLLWVLAAASNQTTYSYRNKAYAYHFDSKRWSPAYIGEIRAANQLTVQNFDVAGFLGENRASDELLFARDVGFGLNEICFLDSTKQTAASATIQTAYIGDPVQLSMVRSVRPRYSTKNTGADGTMVLETRLKSFDGGATASQTAVLDADFKYNTRQTGRYHSVILTLKGRDVVSALDIDLVPVGRR